MKNGEIKTVNGIRYKKLGNTWISENYKVKISGKEFVLQEVRDSKFELINTYNTNIEGVKVCHYTK
jgi:hypothetical protein